MPDWHQRTAGGGRNVAGGGDAAGLRPSCLRRWASEKIEANSSEKPVFWQTTSVFWQNTLGRRTKYPGRLGDDLGISGKGPGRLTGDRSRWEEGTGRREGGRGRRWWDRGRFWKQPRSFGKRSGCRWRRGGGTGILGTDEFGTETAEFYGEFVVLADEALDEADGIGGELVVGAAQDLLAFDGI